MFFNLYGKKNNKDDKKGTEMNIKNNGKIIAIAIALSAGIAFGQYVSVVDAKSSGGFVTADRSMSQADFDDIMPVGSVTFRMDGINPSTLYGGTWDLITGDASLSFGNGSAQSGAVSGNNTPVVPVVAHTHTATFTGNALPAHSHTYADTQRKATSGWGWGWGGSDNFGDTTRTTSAVSAGKPSGSVAVQSAGVSNATLDVRGARIAINVWKRTS